MWGQKSGGAYALPASSLPTCLLGVRNTRGTPMAYGFGLTSLIGDCRDCIVSPLLQTNKKIECKLKNILPHCTFLS